MKLNREQIIKALECCTGQDCYCCPLDRPNPDCLVTLPENALTLIKELIEENDRQNQQRDFDMRAQFQAYANNIKYFEDIYGKELDKLKAEKADVTYFKDQLIADAVRKFVIYLKRNSFNCDPGNGFSFDVIDVDELDDYVKEFLEENK